MHRTTEQHRNNIYSKLFAQFIIIIITMRHENNKHTRTDHHHHHEQHLIGKIGFDIKLQ